MSRLFTKYLWNKSYKITNIFNSRFKQVQTNEITDISLINYLIRKDKYLVIFLVDNKQNINNINYTIKVQNIEYPVHVKFNKSTKKFEILDNDINDSEYILRVLNTRHIVRQFHRKLNLKP